MPNCRLDDPLYTSLCGLHPQRTYGILWLALVSVTGVATLFIESSCLSHSNSTKVDHVWEAHTSLWLDLPQSWSTRQGGGYRDSEAGSGADLIGAFGFGCQWNIDVWAATTGTQCWLLGQDGTALNPNENAQTHHVSMCKRAAWWKFYGWEKKREIGLACNRANRWRKQQKETLAAIREWQQQAFVLKGHRSADKGLWVRQSPKLRGDVWGLRSSSAAGTNLNILIHLKETEVISGLAAVFVEEGQSVLVYSSEDQTSCKRQRFFPQVWVHEVNRDKQQQGKTMTTLLLLIGICVDVQLHQLFCVIK